MSTLEHLSEEESPRANALDPFSFPRRLTKQLRSCAKTAANNGEASITYLWVQVSTPKPTQQKNAALPSLTLDHWLNIIDEAASVGVECLIVSLDVSPAAFPHLWEVCHWAQKTQDMRVGIHLNGVSLNPEEIQALQELDADKTRVLVSKDALETIRNLKAQGIEVEDALPPHDHHSSVCVEPEGMVFVNPEGVLYTCGMVEGQEEFCLGTVFESTFKRILGDDSLPHAIPKDKPHGPSACDGCPPLVAQYFATGNGHNTHSH